MKNLSAFEGRCITTRKINLILEQFQSYEPESRLPIFKKELEDIITEEKFPPQNLEKRNLEKISSNLKSIKKCISELTDIGYLNESIDNTSQKADETSQLLNDVLNNALSIYRENYHSFQKEMKQNKKYLQMLDSIRERMGNENKESLALIDILNPRYHGGSSMQVFYDYKKTLSKISSINEYISSLEMRCTKINVCADRKHEIKSLLRETKNRWRKSQIVKRCIETKYYEGMIRLNQIKNYAKQAKKELNIYYSKKDQKNTKEQKDKKEFDFSAYLAGINHPHNFRYFYVHDILEGRLGLKESERFAKISEIMSAEKVSGKEDIEYIKSLMFGLEQAINYPAEYFAVKEARETYKTFERALDIAS